MTPAAYQRMLLELARAFAALQERINQHSTTADAAQRSKVRESPYDE